MKPSKVLPTALSLLLVVSLLGMTPMGPTASFAYAEADSDAPMEIGSGIPAEPKTAPQDESGGGAGSNADGSSSESDGSTAKDPSPEKQDDSNHEGVLQDSLDELFADNAEEPEALALSEVSDGTELVAAVAAAADGDTIVLLPGFTASSIDIPMPDVAVIIDGTGTVWNAGDLKVVPGGAGSLTVRGLKFDGATLAHSASSGTLRIENAEFYGGTSASPLSITTSGGASTVISRTRIHDNTSSNTASALWVGGASNVEMHYCTIENNVGTGGGYETGAISSKGFSGTLVIANTVFRNNVNTSSNSGIVGGGGGAMAMHYLTGTVNVSASYFIGNKATGPGGAVANTYDGGAIYVLDGRDGAVLNIDATTFEGNIAADDGGAMMLQGTGNPGFTTSITNSTFFGNKAYGLDGANYSGGAIQYFKNGGSSKMTNTITSSTFVGNQGGNESTTTEQRGGAVGLSGAGLFATAAVTRNNSLFVGNVVYGANGEVNTASNYKDLSNFATVQGTPEAASKANVVNVDKGADPAINLKDVLGTDAPVLRSNASGVTAGAEGLTVPTLPIKPEGIADEGYAGTTLLPGTDQRGYTRGLDQGAVEMAWVKYVANGGVYGLNDLAEYTGSEYYEKNAEGTFTEYYTVSTRYSEVQTATAEQLVLTHPEGLVFDGWNTEPDGNGTFYERTVPLADSNITLYAQWKEAPLAYTVSYDSKGGTEVAPETVLHGGFATIPADPTKDGHVFAGWHVDPEFTTLYDFTNPVTSDMTLHAKWEAAETPEPPVDPAKPETPSGPSTPKETPSGIIPKAGDDLGGLATGAGVLVAGSILVGIIAIRRRLFR